MRNLLLVRYGEIFLKGQNRPLFMRALVKRIKYAVKDLGATVLLHIWRRQMLLSIASGTIVYMLLVQMM